MHSSKSASDIVADRGSNLLAPSFGAGPNGSWSYLSGVSVTYTAALNRLIALAKMVRHPSLGILTRRREFNLRGIEEHMLTRGPESAVGGQEQVSASTAQPLLRLFAGTSGVLSVVSRSLLSVLAEPCLSVASRCVRRRTSSCPRSP